MPYRKNDSPMTRFMANETYCHASRASEDQFSGRSGFLPPMSSMALPGLVKEQMAMMGRLRHASLSDGPMLLPTPGRSYDDIEVSQLW